MQISNAISNANFQCKLPMQISNANFLCNFQCNFLCKPMQFPLHTCLQNKYTGAARQRRGRSFASSRPARSIGGVLLNTAQCCPVPDHPLPSSRTLLFSSKPPLPSAARRCPVLPQLPQQCSPSSHSSAPPAPPARCIGGVLPSTARPPLAQLQDAPVQFQTAPIQCCPGMSSAIQYCPDQGGLCCNPSPICQQGQGTHLHQLHQQQQRVQHPTAV